MSANKPRQAALTVHNKTAMLSMLRDARSVVYRNAESLNEAAAVLEYVGQMLRGRVLNGLNDYRQAICDLARKAPPVQWDRVDVLFDTVRKARNDSVHSGDYIRHHATRLVELLLLLEEGLSMSATVVGDLMVQTPTTAELWHNVATIRRAMLTNSFSFLPVQDTNGVWQLVADVSVVRYLKSARNASHRNELLGKQLGKALQDKEIKLTDCQRISPNKNLEDVARAVSNVPALIVEKDENKERLVGILTAFDLL